MSSHVLHGSLSVNVPKIFALTYLWIAYSVVCNLVFDFHVAYAFSVLPLWIFIVIPAYRDIGSPGYQK